MKRFFLSILWLFPSLAMATELKQYLVTPPQKLEIQENCQAFSGNALSEFINNLAYLEEKKMLGDFTIFSPKSGKATHFTFKIDSINLKEQAYSINISEGRFELIAHSWVAFFYGKQTLQQLLDFAQSEEKDLPCLSISDWPNFEKRGYMLDISRDKVPTMQSLFELIDLLSLLKINELQLYTEHTFAYQKHNEVWKDASPLTAKEIQELDKYCQERFIDLVPNQNSFGHMENWLKHDTYLPLAECPTNCNTAWGKMKRTSLDPTNPKSFALMQELYTELLPNFSSPYFNIGGDETIELCEGKSKAECDKTGKGRVYLNYLKQLNAEANKHGKTAQFWGDIILNHTELISELPKNMVPLVWGYNDNFPFKNQLPKFKEAGLDFYVCPGTSTWRSEIGRNKNAFANLKNAAIEGKKNNAKGYLITNWGDFGHFQPHSVVYPSLWLGASYAWNQQEETSSNLAFQLNHFVFKDKTGNTAQAVLKLGDAYLKTNIPNGNANAFHLMLRRHKWTMNGHYQTKHLTIDGLEDAEKEIKEALAILEMAKPTSADSTIIRQELIHASNMAIHGIHLGIARLKAPKQATKKIKKATKQELIAELSQIIAMHKELWIIRNRKGGLQSSASKLEDLLDYYQQ